jgi:hemolysin activation/secretion protein
MDHIRPRPRESRSWHLLRYSLQSSPLILVSSITTGVANAQTVDVPSASELNLPQAPIQQSVLESEAQPSLVVTSIAPESSVVVETTRATTAEPATFSHHPSVEAIAQPTFSTSLQPQSELNDAHETEVAQDVPDTIQRDLEVSTTAEPTTFSYHPSVEAIAQPTSTETIQLSIPTSIAPETSFIPETTSTSTTTQSQAQSTPSSQTLQQSSLPMPSPPESHPVVERVQVSIEQPALSIGANSSLDSQIHSPLNSPTLIIAQVSSPDRLNPSSIRQDTIPRDSPPPNSQTPLQPIVPLELPQLTPPSSSPEGGENCLGNVSVEAVRFEGANHPPPGFEHLKEQIIEDLNDSVSCSELVQAASRVAALYAQHGYTTSGAIAVILDDRHETEAKTILIRVIEGTLTDGDGDGRAVEVVPVRAVENESGGIELVPTEHHRLNSNYVRSRLALATGTPLNINRLEEALQLLQLDPLIRRVSATLSSRPEPGASALRVEVEEADPFRGSSLGSDNARSPSVGSFQRQADIRYGNVLGLGDGLAVGYSNTDGSNGLNTSYTLPLNPRNGTLSFSYSTSSNTVIEPPFDALDIESTSQTYDLTYRQPIIQRIRRSNSSTSNNNQSDDNQNEPSPRGESRSTEAGNRQQSEQVSIFEEFTVGVTASMRDSQTSLLGEPFALSLGSDEEGRTRVSALRFFQEWTQQSDRFVFAVRSQFNIGLGILGASVQESDKGGDIPDSRFVSWQGQAQWVQVLNDREARHRDTLLILRTNAQLSDQFLLSSEQFAIGGSGTVRGYRQDTLQSDNGLFASAELQFPIARVRERERTWSGALYLVPFMDTGFGWNSGDRPNPSPGALASVGIGLQWRIRNPNITARLDWGIPLVSIDGRRDRTWQENGLHFSISFGL